LSRIIGFPRFLVNEKKVLGCVEPGEGVDMLFRSSGTWGALEGVGR
jgi:hypothetical protein